MFSNVIGIAATDSIEQLCDKLGLPSAGLTASQICSASARAVHVLSQACGIALGCILGLFPLLFLDQEAKQLRQCFDEADVDGGFSRDGGYGGGEAGGIVGWYDEGVSDKAGMVPSSAKV